MKNVKNYLLCLSIFIINSIGIMIALNISDVTEEKSDIANDYLALITNLSTYNNAVTNINTFYNDLDEPLTYLYNTNKFLCTGSNLSCASSSKYTDIGLLNVSEYEKIGGKTSYLTNYNSYFSMTESGGNVSNITRDSITNVSFDTSSGLRPTVYVKPGTKAVGSGTIDDPYMFSSRETLVERIIEDNTISERDDFSETCTETTNGIIFNANGQDGLGTFYFACNTANNYVKFAGMYWRVVRINEDASIRLIYSGTSSTDKSGFSSRNTQFNTTGTTSEFVGYKYTTGVQHGNSTNSNIKNILDSWYNSKLSVYDEYISKTAIYCNDRTVDGTWDSSTNVKYQALSRAEGYSPTYACTQLNDRFTVSNSGNGSLDKPIGLISLDEVIYAGGKLNEVNTSYYLALNALNGVTDWWTMSPSTYTSGQNPYEFMIGASSENGAIKSNGVISSEIGVRPVISLKACVNWSSGDGTERNPYTVSITNACKGVDNEVLESGKVRVSATVTDARMASVNPVSSVIIDAGGSHTFTFKVANGHEYDSLSDCPNGTYNKSNNTLAVSNVTSDTYCKVNFNRKKTVTLTVNNGTVSGGATSNTKTNELFNEEASTTFTVTPNNYYVSEGSTVTCDNGASGTISGNTVTINGVNNDNNCVLNFKKRVTVTLTVNNGTVSGGSTSTTKSNVLSEETSTTFTVTPNSMYTTDGATVTCDNGASGTISGNTVTINGISVDNNCVLTFKLKKTVTLTVYGGTVSGGSTSTTKSNTLAEETSTTFTVSPSSNYSASGAKVLCNNGATISLSGSTVTVSNISGDNNCTLYYALTLSYTGGTQTFTALVSGKYVIEAYGAQGQSSSYYPGGYGGYIRGTINLTAGETLTINVGGQYGYNGGGSGETSGGGATTVRKGSVYVLAAAGGGGATDDEYGGTGGYGNGAGGSASSSSATSGSAGTIYYGSYPNGGGGSGESYTVQNCWASCPGCTPPTTGGCSGSTSYPGNPGSGGRNAYNSSYLTSVSTSSGARSGNGYIRITYSGS